MYSFDLTETFISGMQQPGYSGQAGYPGQYPEQYGRGQEYSQQYPQQGYPPSRPGPVYPQYAPPGPENDNRNYSQGIFFSIL